MQRYTILSIFSHLSTTFIGLNLFLLVICHIFASQNKENPLWEQRYIAGWSSWLACRAHNPEVGGSSPPPATKKENRSLFSFFVAVVGSFSVLRLGRLIFGCQMCSVACATMEYRLRSICSNKFGIYSQPIFQTFGFSAHFPSFGLLSASAAGRVLAKIRDVRGLIGNIGDIG